MTEEENKQKNDLFEKNINSQQEKNRELETLTIEVKKTNNEIEVTNNNKEYQNTDDRINEKSPQ